MICSKSKSSVTRRIVIGLGANFFGQIVTVIIQMVSIPIFIKFWGVELYGEWLAISAVTTYFALSDVGFSNVAANEMTMAVARGDRERAKEVFQSTWVLICIVSIFVLAVTLPTIFVFPINSLLNIEISSLQQVRFTLIILVFHILLSLQTGMITAGFRCEGNYAFGVLFQNIQRLIEFLALMVVVAFKGTILHAAVTYFLIRLLTFFVLRKMLKMKSPWIEYKWFKADFKIIKELAWPAFAYMAYPIGNMLNIQGMVIVVSHLLGPVYVVSFTALRTLSRLAFQVIDKMKNTIWPEISMAYGSGDLQIVRNLHRKAVQSAAWFAFCFVVLLFFAGEWIVDVWTNKSVVFNTPFFRFLLLSILANSFWYISSVIQNAINRHQLQATIYLSANFIAISLTYLLLPKIGLAGASISLLIIDVAMSIYVLTSSLSTIGDRSTSFLKNVLSPPIWIFPFLTKWVKNMFNFTKGVCHENNH